MEQARPIVTEYGPTGETEEDETPGGHFEAGRFPPPPPAREEGSTGGGAPRPDTGVTESEGTVEENSKSIQPNQPSEEAEEMVGRGEGAILGKSPLRQSEKVLEQKRLERALEAEPPQRKAVRKAGSEERGDSAREREAKRAVDRRLASEQARGRDPMPQDPARKKKHKKSNVGPICAKQLERARDRRGGEQAAGSNHQQLLHPER